MRRARVPLQARFYIIFPIGYVLLFPLCSLMTIQRDWRCFLACIRNRYNDVGKGIPVEWENGDYPVMSSILSLPTLSSVNSDLFLFLPKLVLKLAWFAGQKLASAIQRGLCSHAADAFVVFRIQLCRFTCSYMRLIIVGHHHDSMK